MFQPMLLVFAIACNAGEAPVAAPSTEAPAAAEAPAKAEPPAEANAATDDSSADKANAEDGGAAASAEDANTPDHAGLAKADLADGNADKIVHKCAGCALSMDGDAAHSIETHGYTLHMCSAACKSHYEADLDGNLAKLTP